MPADPHIGQWSRLMSIKQLAAYCDVSGNTVKKWVDENTLPEPIQIGGRVLWDKLQIDRALDRLTDENAMEGWDSIG